MVKSCPARSILNHMMRERRPPGRGHREQSSTTVPSGRAPLVWLTARHAARHRSWFPRCHGDVGSLIDASTAPGGSALTQPSPNQDPAAVRPVDEAPHAIVDLREPRLVGVGLTVFSPDLSAVVHASHGAHVTAQLVSLVGALFAYTAFDCDGRARTFDARVVVPYGAGRPVVVEAWPRSIGSPSDAPGPHAELAAALAKLDHRLDAAATLDTYLHCCSPPPARRGGRGARACEHRDHCRRGR